MLPLSDLTDKTLASGLTPDKGDDPSLLSRLLNAVMVFKDFTTVLEMRREQRAAVLAQLREIYDGRFDKSWGTGKELHWQGRLSVLAGVTSAVRFSDTLVRRTLEDLKALDLIDEDGGLWAPRGDWPAFFTALAPRLSPRVRDAVMS